jgi:O-antigen/teichoic acid export membrane protein
MIFRRLLALQRYRIANDGFWVALGQGSGIVAALVSVRVITELLLPADFGLLSLLLGISALGLGVAANPRLQALMRFYPDCVRGGQLRQLRVQSSKDIAKYLVWTALAVCALWLGASSVLGGTWYTGILIAGLLITDAVRMFEISLFSAARRHKEVAMISMADAWSRPLMAFTGISIFGASAETALAGYIAGALLVIIPMKLALRLEGREEHIELATRQMGSDGSNILELMRRYALPLAPLAIFGWLSGMGDRYVISGMLGLANVGLYAAAHGLASRPFLALFGVIEAIMRPILQNAIADRDMNAVFRLKRRFIAVTLCSATLGVVGFFALTPIVVDLFLAEEYHVAVELIPYIALGYAIYMVSCVFARFCYAFDATRSVLLLTVGGAFVGLLTILPAIYFFGLLGAALALPARFAAECAISYFAAARAERCYVSRSSTGVVL